MARKAYKTKYPDDDLSVTVTSQLPQGLLTEIRRLQLERRLHNQDHRLRGLIEEGLIMLLVAENQEVAGESKSVRGGK